MKELGIVEAKHIISEPGDGTRYDYIMVQIGPDEFVFAPYRNTFKYPQKINVWEALNDERNLDKDKVVRLAKKEGVNPYTYMECARSALEYILEGT